VLEALKAPEALEKVSSAESRWDERIARARELAVEYSPAAQILTFYADLAEYQQSLILFSSRSHETGSPLTRDFIETVDLDGASAAVPDFLVWLRGMAPALLARAAAATARLQRQEWRQLMCRCLTQPDPTNFETTPREADDTTMFVVEAVLQPFAEAAALEWRADGHLKVAQVFRPAFAMSATGVRASRCPICSGRPAVGILREEGHGARRTLLCALCLNEWEFPRVVCPACDEQRFDALPVYTAEMFAHVRINACDSCKRYLKTVDLTKNGLAVPLVDDLASVPLDLWAHEQGYRRLRTNLLRTADVPDIRSVRL
jgi:formate dehydrogenase maturation protein FdhE